MKLHHSQLEQDLSALGKNAVLSMSQRQKIRDQLFKKIGQTTLVDAFQTQTEVRDLIMPVSQLRSIFQPRRIALGLPATLALTLAVFLGTFATSVMAKDASGGALYSVRKVIEEVQIAFTPSEHKVERRLEVVDKRLRDVVAGPEAPAESKVQAVLQESKAAIAKAQSTVSDLKQEDSESAKDLATKLAAVISSQKVILTDLASDKPADEEVQKTIVTMREELDELLPKVVATVTGDTPPTKIDTTAVVVKEAETDSEADEEDVVAQKDPVPLTLISPTTFDGSLTFIYGQPAIISDNKTYLLLGSPIDLVPYIGRSGVVITGRLTEYGIVVSRITLDSKLIGQNPGKDDIGSLGVEDIQTKYLSEY